MRRREFLGTMAAGAAQAAGQPFTEFQIACMTLPYNASPIERALQGIAGAGYKYVAWGTTHKNSAGQNVPAMGPDAPATAAAALAARCRDLGLEPVMMFGVVYLSQPNAIEVYKRRVEQAAAAKIPYILSFCDPRSGAAEYPAMIRTLKAVGPAARAAGVTIAIKQHGGVTATGRQCARVIDEVGDEGVRMFYDAGNTFWYPGVDPIPDLPSCASYIRGFCMKDFRDFPKRTTCGPGLGSIDHYKLLAPVMRTGLKMPLACENIFEPFLPHSKEPEAIDVLARRKRELLESEIAGKRAG